uniref:Uncharacterized protein n=1 Tax=Sphaerodactylus townsendi TaxID=933632 RepID=A0ACB8ET10_9SAUR
MQRCITRACLHILRSLFVVTLTMQAARCPTDELSLSNCAVVNEKDFQSGLHVVVRTSANHKYVFTLRSHQSVVPGTIAFSLPQVPFQFFFCVLERYLLPNWEGLVINPKSSSEGKPKEQASVTLPRSLPDIWQERENGAGLSPIGAEHIDVSVYNFDKTKQCIGTMTIEIDFLQKKSVDSNPYDSDKMAAEFIQQFNNQSFTVGQQLVFSFSDKLFGLLVKDIEAMDPSILKGEPASGKKQKIDVGLVVGNSQVAFEKADSSSLTLIGKSKTRENRQSIINPDWNFEKMGIGGLDKEFSDIFRRAFASRVFPPEIVEQMEGAFKLPPSLYTSSFPTQPHGGAPDRTSSPLTREIGCYELAGSSTPRTPQPGLFQRRGRQRQLTSPADPSLCGAPARPRTAR